MTEVIKAEQMPATVRAARLIMTIEVAFGLVSLAMMIGVAAADFSPGFLLLIPCAALFPALMGWVLSRWPSRRKYVRWSAVAVDVAACGLYVTTAAIHDDLDWVVLLSPSTFLPVAVVIVMLTPSAGRWFAR
ncbi:hypothetical protein [Nonomuraea zeae]|uniref:DUF2568 domain-containing protein n=1 Tax=Nonomuraea zeae TaxID=1642303 RepID=A0A5S4G5S0_9ACTN|nr:hypothetical protein [Nonomuraea zeae]TMR27864.1 hypothetical protein ETD85_37790 [Nonomuraea zeae]